MTSANYNTRVKPVVDDSSKLRSFLTKKALPRCEKFSHSPPRAKHSTLEPLAFRIRLSKRKFSISRTTTTRLPEITDPPRHHVEPSKTSCTLCQSSWASVVVTTLAHFSRLHLILSPPKSPSESSKLSCFFYHRA